LAMIDPGSFATAISAFMDAAKFCRTHQFSSSRI
jgi:hypothetical protein